MHRELALQRERAGARRRAKVESSKWLEDFVADDHRNTAQRDIAGLTWIFTKQFDGSIVMRSELSQSALSKDDEDRSLIRAAMVYRGGDADSVSMGSQAIAGLYPILGLSYGEGGFNKYLETATRAQIDALLTRCSSVIQHMRKHPT
jgi:hypothetical protein